MADVRRKWLLDVLLRVAGAASLGVGALLMRWLFTSAALHQRQELTLLECAAAALGFVLLSIGSALATLGRHILDPVPVSARWATRYDAFPKTRSDLSSRAYLVEPDPEFIGRL